MNMTRYFNRPTAARCGAPAGDIFSAFDRFFDSGVSPLLNGGERDWVPSLDLVENKDAYDLSMDLPGMDQKDIHLAIQENALTISGERVAEEKGEEDGVRHTERAWGRFSRSIRLPENVDASKVNADYKAGVLQVSLPKAEEAKPQKIEVKVH
jgi:HSP20 family protein